MITPVIDMVKDLTKSGWPRPIIGGWPIPWVSPHSDLSKMSPARTRRILYNKLCQVCGKGHAKGSTVFMCLDSDKSYLSDEGQEFHNSYCIPMDSALMHERCFKLAVGMCPKLLEMRERNGLLCLSVNIDDIKISYMTKIDQKDFNCPAGKVDIVELDK